MKYAFSPIIPCTECGLNIDTDRDPFCFVTPNRMLYHYVHGQFIPLCRVCRSLQRYDIEANYSVAKEPQRVHQPDLPLLEYKPGHRSEERIPESIGSYESYESYEPYESAESSVALNTTIERE